MKKITYVFLVLFSLGLVSCGPSICDCKDLLGNSVKKSIDNLLEGEKPDLAKEKDTFDACKEKYGDLSPAEVIEKLKECK